MTIYPKACLKNHSYKIFFKSSPHQSGRIKRIRGTKNNIEVVRIDSKSDLKSNWKFGKVMITLRD